MDKDTAMEWAVAIGSYWALAEAGSRTLADADGIADDLADAIGREAEAGGWYCEWESALDKAREPKPCGMTFGQEMHALANPRCKAKTMAEALPFYMKAIKRCAEAGGDRVTFSTWIDSKDGSGTDRMPKLKLNHARELAKLLGYQGLTADVRPGGRTGIYVVVVDW